MTWTRNRDSLGQEKGGLYEEGGVPNTHCEGSLGFCVNFANLTAANLDECQNQESSGHEKLLHEWK